MPQSDSNNPFDRQLARIAVGAYDDAQQTRTAMMNRIRDLIRKVNEDIAFDEVEDEKDPDERDYDAQYKDENLPDLVDEMMADGLLTQHEHQYLTQMLEAARAAERVEQQYQDVMGITEHEPIYTEWLQYVNGISTTLTAKLIHRFGYCEDYDRVSNLWSYSGLAPGQTRTRGEQLNYDPQAKTLAWIAADCIIKQGGRSTYKTEFYDPYKQKQLNRMERAEDMTEEELESVEWTPPESRGHADNRARRYLSKKFLKHYWAIARDTTGLETPDEWVIAHGGHEKDAESFENPFYARRELMPPA